MDPDPKTTWFQIELDPFSSQLRVHLAVAKGGNQKEKIIFADWVPIGWWTHINEFSFGLSRIDGSHINLAPISLFFGSGITSLKSPFQTQIFFNETDGISEIFRY